MSDIATVAAIAYARKLAMEGLSPSLICYEALDAGWPVTPADALMVWEQCQQHNEAVKKAMNHG